MVTAPSSDTLQKLIQIQHVDSARTRRLPWPLNPDFVQLAEQREFSLPANFPQGRVILTIGRAAASEQYKGTDSLIQAVAQLSAAIPDLHLVAVGGGDDLDRLKNLAADSAAAGRVHFLQGLSRAEIAGCYSRCEIFALPSAGEGFGLVFLEAMAFGKPVVAAASGGAVDLVQDGENGLLVPVRDAAALTSALRRLLEHTALRQALGAKGAAVVRERYSFESFRAELEILLKECALAPR
jgi:glycosyltransferase involved in cell wall biosynthesis